VACLTGTRPFHGSIAYAHANTKIGILTTTEFAAIEKGFAQMLQEWQSDTFKIIPGVESTRLTSAASARLLAPTSPASCTLAAAATTKSLPACASGCATSSAPSKNTSFHPPRARLARPVGD
jgi:hypothetical protein